MGKRNFQPGKTDFPRENEISTLEKRISHGKTEFPTWKNRFPVGKHDFHFGNSGFHQQFVQDEQGNPLRCQTERSLKHCRSRKIDLSMKNADLPDFSRSKLLLGFFFVFATTSFARMMEMPGFTVLAKECTHVFAGKIVSLDRSGIQTPLFYPSWQKVLFEWLKVKVEVTENLKGAKQGEIVDVALLAIATNSQSQPMFDGPTRIEPVKGDKYLFCLVPTTTSNLFASYTAPFDDANAIFALNKSKGDDSFDDKDPQRRNDPDVENRRVIRTLNERGGEGPGKIRKEYRNELTASPGERMVYLQWESRTNAAGWVANFPKTNTVPVPESKP